MPLRPQNLHSSGVAAIRALRRFNSKVLGWGLRGIMSFPALYPDAAKGGSSFRPRYYPRFIV